MAVFKRGQTWRYKFVWNGELIRESTKQSNKRIAEQIESARKTALAKGEAGIKKRPDVPTLSGFQQRFTQAIETRCSNKTNTVNFYKEKFRRLLEFPPLAKANLSDIDEHLIERYIQTRRTKVGIVSVNRELATLRRALRLAHEWKILDRVPRIRLLSGEPIRDFVLTRENEQLYLAIAPQPLHDIVVLVLDTGLRLGEALSLEWRDVHATPTAGARFGYIRIRDGKSRNAKREVSITGRVSAMFETRRKECDSHLVFPTIHGSPYLGTYLNRLHQKARETLKFPSGFVLHSLRHTMLTRLGEAGVDAFTIMKIAGHSSITISQRYVHPSTQAMENAIAKLERHNAGTVHGVGTNLGTSPKNENPEAPISDLF